MTWVLSMDNGDELSGGYRRGGEVIDQQTVSERIQFPGSSIVSIHTMGSRAPETTVSFLWPASTEGDAQIGKTALTRAFGQFATLRDLSTGNVSRVRIAQPVIATIRRGAASFGGTTYAYRVEADVTFEVVA